MNPRDTVAALLLSVVTALVAAPTVASQPDMPPWVDARALHEQFARDGKGIETAPAAPGRVTVYVVFDPQCPDCIKFWNEARPLADKVRFVWLPVAILNPKSEPQGAAILAAPDRAAAMEQHMTRFGSTPRAVNHSGLARDGHPPPSAESAAPPISAREDVWTNSRIFRRGGGRSVPFGVFRDANGAFKVIPDTRTTAELQKLLGVN